MIQFADGTFAFLVDLCLLTCGVARKLSLTALAPTRIAVCVIVFNA
ncbi:hypothetical protein ACFQNF_12775 [Iodobacter arcticus]|uniref:Uncharacterized protein n=1 Tax=Iodobacter arcticus TaxID=590593 RepID=A0ABW2QZ47_9NEIS